MAFSSGKNPFMDDPDDDEFLARRDGGATNSSRYDPFGPPKEDPPPYDDEGARPLTRYEMLQHQKQQSINRQLDSTQRCIATIYDSEQTGIATAEELVYQGEQLDNVERKLDKINADTKVSQRHLNSIKSIFGGIRNWWAGEGKKDETPTPTASSKDRSGLRQTIADADQDAGAPSGTHPAFRLRADNTAGFYDDDVVEFGSSGPTRVAGSQLASSRIETGAPGQPGLQSQSGVQSQPVRSADWQEYESKLNADLDVMSKGMARLKNLASGMGDEILAQNDQIDRVTLKAERADTKVRDQNRQMRQILGK